ncbi:MAG: GLPGLI family protein [Prevotella sp.]|nr:GLPGLI family protein [Prevotella sp.]
MNKRIITLIALAAVCGGVMAQQKQSTATRPRQVDYGVVKAKVIGTSNIRILYAFNAKNLKDEDTWIDCGQLLTDKGMTQYASHFLAENDEALRAWLKANPHKSNYPNALKLKGFRKDIWSEYQYSQIFVRGRELTEWAVMPAAEFIQYRYKEPWPSMTWTLGSEKQSICGYQCQKATCHWRGRDYEAWFASQIPLKSGPWKFGGLPGLIMKIYDTKHLYTWETVSVENGSFPIYQLEERFFKDTDRKKVWKMQRDYNIKYNELSGRMYNGTMQMRTERYPYDQLELE